MKIPVNTVRVGDFSMDWIRFGRGEHPLVILPGLSIERVCAYADAVARAYAPLSEDFTIYLFDRRNELPDDYPVRDMARDTAVALQALGLSSVCLFGASQGGMIAMEMAIRYPERVRKLVLGSTTACMTGERFRAVAEWIRLAKAGDAVGLYLSFGEAIYPRALFDASREVLIRSAKFVTAEGLNRFVILAQGMQGFDVSADLSKIACPTLVIGSADDRVLGPDASDQIVKRLGNRADCELYRYDGYGHAAYDTAPDYKDRISRFLLRGLAD